MCTAHAAAVRLHIQLGTFAVLLHALILLGMLLRLHVLLAPASDLFSFSCFGFQVLWALHVLE